MEQGGGSAGGTRVRPLLALLLAAMCAVGMWGYVERVLIPHQQHEPGRLAAPGGNLSDLYPRWYGARALLREGRDPYRAEVTREIQQDYYGQPAGPDSGGTAVRDEQAFAYPVYVVVLLAPAAWLPFSAVEAGYKALSLLMVAGGLFAWSGVAGWPRGWRGRLAVLVAAGGTFPFIQGYKLQQFTLLVFMLLSSMVWLLARQHLAAAGVLLALATIKPQLVVLVIPLLLAWALADWQQRQGLVWGFSCAMAALLAASEVLLPGWLPEWVHALAEYRRYTGAMSPSEAWLGPAGLAVAAVATGVCVWVGWRRFGWDDFRAASSAEGTLPRPFVFWLALALWLPLLSSVGAAAYNHLMMLPLLLWLASEPGTASRLSKLLWLLLASPWLAAWVVLVIQMTDFGLAERLWFLPLAPVLLAPLLTAGLVWGSLRRPSAVTGVI